MQKDYKTVNILVVVRWPVGGIRTYMKYVYSRFKPDNYRFTIIGPDIEEFDVLIDDLKDINITAIRVNETGFYRNFLKILLREISGKKYDLIHSHGFTSGIFTSWIAYIFRVIHMMTTHDVFRATQFPGIKGKLKKLLIYLPFRLINIIQAVSYDAQNNLTDTFPGLVNRKQKITTIHNGIEVDRFDTDDKRDFIAELKLPENAFVIGFLGRFMSQKGFRFLVDAMETLLSDEALDKVPVVVAVGSDGFLSEEMRIIERKQLGDNIKFLPFEPDISKILNGLDVLAIPSLWEACPLLPMESLVSGTPTIASDCIGLREVVKDTPAVVIKAGDANKLAGAITDLINNYDRTVFRDFVPEAKIRFDVENTFSELRALYDEVLGKEDNRS